MELEWLKLATELGSLGVVVWLVFHTFSKLLPEMHQRFGEEMTREREAHSQAIRHLARAMERLSAILLYRKGGAVKDSVGLSNEELLRYVEPDAEESK